MHEPPVVWWFVLWGLYLLLPLVPTIVIYKLFPTTTVTVSGPLSNLTINATGAFAAYVVTVLLGTFIVLQITSELQRLPFGRWVVEGQLIFKDAAGKPVEDLYQRQQLLRNLKVATMPPQYSIRTNGFVTVETTVDERRLPTLTYSIPEFGSTDQEPTEKVANWDRKRGTITFRDPIVIWFAAPVPGTPQVPQAER
jgi:hypothetical protein